MRTCCHLLLPTAPLQCPMTLFCFSGNLILPLPALMPLRGIGYRTNSKKAIAFRQWATKTLKDHIYKGFTINQTRLQKHYTEFLKALEKRNDIYISTLRGYLLSLGATLELVASFPDGTKIPIAGFKYLNTPL